MEKKNRVIHTDVGQHGGVSMALAIPKGTTLTAPQIQRAISGFVDAQVRTALLAVSDGRLVTQTERYRQIHLTYTGIAGIQMSLWAPHGTAPLSLEQYSALIAQFYDRATSLTQ